MWIKATVLLCCVLVASAIDEHRPKKKDDLRDKRNTQYSISHHYSGPESYRLQRRISTGPQLPLYQSPFFPGPRSSYHKGRPYSLPAPPYAVQMEPLFHYSQRDPLYDTNFLSLNTDGPQDDLLTDTNHLSETVYGPQHHTRIIERPVYIKEPEPIIEIIIKESNVTLPPPPSPPPPAPKKKEQVQVFYVKYKKNPNGHGKDSVIYDKPVAAISPPIPEEPEEPPQHHHHHEVVTSPPPPSTTLRTIIKPDSEVYHSPSGVKVTFGKESFDYQKRSNKPEDYNETPRSSSIQFPQGRQLSSFPPTSPRRPPTFNYNQDFRSEPPRQPQPYRPFTQSPQFRPSSQQYNRPSISHYSTLPRYTQKNPQFPPPRPAAPPQRSQYQRQPVPYQPFESLRNQQQTVQFRPQTHFPITQQPPLSQSPAVFNQFPQQNRQVEAQKLNKPFQGEQKPISHQGFQFEKPQIYQQSFQEEKHGNQHGSQQGGANHQQINQQGSQQGSVNHQQINQQGSQQGSVGNHQQINHHGFQEGEQHNNQQSFQQGGFVNQQGFRPDNIVTHQNQQQNQHFHQENQPNFQNFQHNQQQGLQQLQQTPLNVIPPGGELIQSLPKFEQHISIVESNQQQQPQALPLQPQQHQQQSNQLSQPEFKQSQQPSNQFSQTEYNQRIQEQYRQANLLQESIRQQQPSQEQFFNPNNFNYQTTTKATTYFNQNQFNSNEFYHTTSKPPTSTTTTQATTTTTKEPEKISTTTKDPKILNAQLPDEVPEDLRAQLLSSGILNNADISILDYDKVGDIPLSALPPDQLANFYGAGGGQQIAANSDPVPAYADAPVDEEAEASEIQEVKAKPEVEMKVVHYDPQTERGQQVQEAYVKDDATQVDPVVLNDEKYNRYLPLKVSGTQFPIPDVAELRGKKITSVVVLAPVAYDFSAQRTTREAKNDDIELIKDEDLKELIKNPTSDNYKKFLDRENKTRSDKQAVILLVTSSTDGAVGDKEIFMYDIATQTVSKLNGELSSAFVEAAEANASKDVEPQPSNIVETRVPYPGVAASSFDDLEESPSEFVESRIPIIDPMQGDLETEASEHLESFVDVSGNPIQDDLTASASSLDNLISVKTDGARST